MSHPPAESSSQGLDELLQALPLVISSAQHSELWGVDLQNDDRQVIQIVLQKYLAHHSLLPSLQVARAKAALAKTLQWRRRNDPRALLSEARSILPELGLLHITKAQGQYVLWVTIDEETMKGHSTLHDNLSSSYGIEKLGLAALELLASSLPTIHPGNGSIRGSIASCVVDFRLRERPQGRQQRYSFRSVVCKVLEELVPLIHSFYPHLWQDIHHPPK